VMISSDIHIGTVIGIINALAIANPRWKITPVILYLKKKQQQKVKNVKQNTKKND